MHIGKLRFMQRRKHRTDAESGSSTLAQARQQADQSSAKNRNFFIAYLALAFYVLVMALGVSDKELLLNQRELPIPLLALGLTPLVWFWIAPCVLFGMYLDMVLNLKEHVRKLCHWRDTCPSKALPLGQVQPFFVDFAFAHRGQGLWGRLYHLLLWLAVFLTPLALLVCLVQFGKFQSIATSGLHLGLLLFALLLAGYFMGYWHKEQSPNSQPCTPLWKCVLHWFALPTRWWGFAIGLVGLLYTGLIYLFATAQTVSFFQGYLDEDVATTPVKTLASGAGMAIDWLDPRLQVSNTVLVSVDDTEKQALEILQQRQSADQSQADTKTQSLADLWWAHGARLNLRGRNLNHADLSGSLLPRADLSKTQLQGADLSEAQLQGAQLWKAQLQGAQLWKAQLQGAKLRGAQLQGADLRWAQLQGAKLRRAQLQGAHLAGARLQGADLSEAQLQGAQLWRAQLQGAQLWKAQLQGAVLEQAQLQGAILEQAQLQGAYLMWAQLQGANLSEAQLQGAQLWRAQLQGAGCNTNDQVPNSIASCEKHDWYIQNEDQARQLIETIKLPEGGQSEKTYAEYFAQRIEGSVGKTIWQQALCGELTPEMQKTIAQYKNNPEGVPLEIQQRWAEKTQPCPALQG